MNYKLSLVYTALFTGISVSALAETQHKAGTEMIEQINVQDTGIKQNGYQTTGTSVVSKAEVPVFDTPNTVNILSTKLLEDRKPESLIDALYNVSGVSQANTLGGMFDAIQKRGFGRNRDNSIMRNGLQAGPAKNFSATTETVEILKGPASVLYGIQDPGGVVNIITKKPQQTPRYAVGGTLGNHSLWGTQLDFTGGLGNGFAYRFIYDKQEKDYWRNFGKIKSTTYAPSLSWENDKTKVLLSYEHKDILEPFDRGTSLLTATNALPDIPVSRRLDEPNNETTAKTDNIDFKIEHKLSDGWKLNAGYSYARYKYFYNQARITNINVTDVAIPTVKNKKGAELSARHVRRAIEQQQGDQRVHSGTLNIVGEFGISDIANRFVAGIDAMRNIRDLGPIYNQGIMNSDINIDNPNYTSPVAAHKNGNGNAYQYNYLKTVGVYIQDTAYFTDNFIMTGGLRYEYFDQFAGRHCLNAANCKKGQNLTKTGNTDQHDGKLLYQLGAVYKFTPHIATFANYSESFRPQMSVATPVSSDLKPEQGKSFEIGAKYENSGFNTTLALFNISKRNVAESVGSSSNAQLNIVGKQRSRGVEFDLNGQITDSLSVAANYTYTKVKSLENELYPDAVNQQLSGVPKHQSSLFLAYNIGEFDFGHIRVGGGARYLGSWYAYNSTYTKVYKLPHSVVYDAFIAYDTKVAGKKLSFQLNGKNLSNTVYYPSTSGNASGTLIPVALGYAREVILNTKIEF
ncbi:ligand-gated channel protein [Haemophilus influenzae]|uniref:TonB-dependent siderophore receptor n=1 Tax=Haemophilus influenzae TaxID=727 RepID=UPI00045B3685|nr:TonB-dependent receptor [Haemophilus influenzae]KAI97515.1 ligand-gated channel protein [Haemophilus influenzae]KAI99474.1 ligand-gated channel protein [Haemophilus influenzae]KAI99797.1 ligand-gated channel protein [Haemophilus influenzae]MCK9676314.1 TonB-dependent receptor [Haemophilus influenzae]RFN75627.1 TonB-dependent siderophore receptor [Haemophilus influenzae]